ncbi:MAG: glutamate racemase [Bacilli bacterium]|jgi:glutamate racemase|nr:glutamate racemase [Bacilli bacterium]
MNNGYIGVVDSGVGGLDILNVLVKAFPNENFYYIGDNLNLPYGAKSKEQLEHYGITLAKYLKNNNTKMILIACNTLSLNAIHAMRMHVDIPIYGIVRPTIKGMLNDNDIKSILLIATRATINSHRYVDFLNELGPEINVYDVATPELVDYIEANKPELYNVTIKKYVDAYQDKVDGIILGCTHYPIIKDYFKKLYPHLKIFDAREQMKQLCFEKLKENNIVASANNKREIIIHATKSIIQLQNASAHFFNYQDTILKEGGISFE